MTWYSGPALIARRIHITIQFKRKDTLTALVLTDTAQVRINVRERYAAAAKGLAGRSSSQSCDNRIARGKPQKDETTPDLSSRGGPGS